MARYTGPKSKIARKFGEPIFGPDKVLAKKNYPPGQHGNSRRRKTSEYGIQLREKQKVRRTYGLLEKQFARLYKEADRSSNQGILPGELLLQFLERRLDNVIYRAGFASSRRAARQLVGHGHFMLNGRRVDIPSIRVKAGDVITLRDKSKNSAYFINIKDVLDNSFQGPLSWLKSDPKKVSVTITGLPKREEAEADINEQLIVEYYSR